MVMEYSDNDGKKIFEQFKGKIFYNAKLSIPTSKYPALFVYVGDISREPFALKRQDWWVINFKFLLYTLDHSENDMDDHYKWAEGLDRVFRLNPRMHLTGEEDLGIHKGDVESVAFNFAFGDNFVISETDATITIRTKLCPANQMS
jgi:hypothetical protein